MAGFSWPWLKPASPNLTKIASDIAGNPVSWFVLFILGLASVVMSGGMRRPPMPISPGSGAEAGDAAAAPQSRVQQRFPTTDWDKPLTSVFRQNFKNETVELDGKNFVECSFENVTFLYQGTRPFQMINCKRISAERFLVSVRTDNPIVFTALSIMSATGVSGPIELEMNVKDRLD
jgi:hypothetical protein